MVRKNHRYPVLHAEKQTRFNIGNGSSCLNLLDISLTFFNYLYVVLSCFVSLKWAFLARTVALCLLQGAGNAGDAHASDTRPLPRELWWVREGKAQAPHQRQPLQPLRDLNVIWMINQPTTGKRTSMICGLIWMASAVQNPSFGAIGRNPGNTQKSMLLTSNRGDRTNKMQPGGCMDQLRTQLSSYPHRITCHIEAEPCFDRFRAKNDPFHFRLKVGASAWGSSSRKTSTYA